MSAISHPHFTYCSFINLSLLTAFRCFQIEKTGYMGQEAFEQRYTLKAGVNDLGRQGQVGQKSEDVGHGLKLLQLYRSVGYRILYFC